MDPWSGDVSRPATLEKYGYSHGDPVQNVDPSGNETLLGMLGAIGVAGQLNAMYQEALKESEDQVYAGWAGKVVMEMIRINLFYKWEDEKELHVAMPRAAVYNAMLAVHAFYVTGERYKISTTRRNWSNRPNSVSACLSTSQRQIS